MQINLMMFPLCIRGVILEIFKGQWISNISEALICILSMLLHIQVISKNERNYCQMPHISRQWPNPNFWLNNPQTIRNRLMDILRFLFTFWVLPESYPQMGPISPRYAVSSKKVFASQISNFLHYCEIGNFFKRVPILSLFLFCSSVTEIVVVCTSNLNPQSQCCDNLIFLLSGTIEGGSANIMLYYWFVDGQESP